MSRAPSPPRYIGQNLALRFLPSALIVLALGTLFSGAHSIPLTLFVASLGIVPSVTVPWRFAVVDEGIALWFGFGRRRFLPMDEITVRVNHNGAIAKPRAERFGYPLADGIVERRRDVLRAVLVEHGFEVVE